MAIIIHDPDFTRKYKEYENDDFPVGEDLYYITPSCELNFYLTLVQKFQELVPVVQEEVGMSKEIQVITEYPKDLTKFKSPAIVIRQVNTDDDQIVQEGTVAVTEGENTTQIDLDTYSMKMNFYVQFDCVAGTKLDRLKLKCIIQNCFIRLQRFPLLDFTDDFVIGKPMKMQEEIRKRGEFTQWSSTHDTLDYIAIFRQNFYVKVIIVPYKNIVDISRLEISQYTFFDDSPSVDYIIEHEDEFEGNNTHYQNFNDD